MLLRKYEMFWHVLPLLFLICTLAAAGAPYAVKETHVVPSQWSQRGPAPPGHPIRLHFGLKHNIANEDLEQHLLEVSDPSHPRYGEFFTPSRLNGLLKPTNITLQVVQEWLGRSGFNLSRLTYTAAKDWVSLTTTIHTAERLLNTNYSMFEHEDGTVLFRAPEWSLPVHLHNHIDVIQPTNSFYRLPLQRRGQSLKTVEPLPPRQAFNTHSTVGEVCNSSSMTPLCLSKLYGTFNYKQIATKKNSIGMTNFDGQCSNISDIELYLERFRPTFKLVGSGEDSFIPKFVSIAGAVNDQSPITESEAAARVDIEGNLDAETILGLTWPLKLELFGTGTATTLPPFNPDLSTPTNTNEPFLEWLLGMKEAGLNLPNIISTSYGDDEQTVPFSYARKVCTQFAALGLQGISLFFAAGDSGVGEDPYCYSDNGTTAAFVPEFPASCPFVTTVGATMGINPELLANNPENGFVGGSGFSNYFPRPKYQKPAVESYLAKIGSTFDGLYNKSGRAYPDISAQGYRYAIVSISHQQCSRSEQQTNPTSMPLVHSLSIFASLLIQVEQVWNGSIIHVDGTSASAPTAASIFALVNDARIAKGKKRLGFLNPTLYSSKVSSTFTDIIIGNAAGCGVVGFQATDGWDAATGLGTPVSCEFAHYFEHASSTNIMSASGISTTCRCFTLLSIFLH
jgi:tripeptidyl-peptidase-1